MKYALIVMAVLIPLAGAGIVIMAVLVGAYTGEWGWMILSILMFGASLALASLMINKFNQINREEHTR